MKFTTQEVPWILLLEVSLNTSAQEVSLRGTSVVLGEDSSSAVRSFEVHSEAGLPPMTRSNRILLVMILRGE